MSYDKRFEKRKKYRTLRGDEYEKASSINFDGTDGFYSTDEREEETEGRCSYDVEIKIVPGSYNVEVVVR